jgi:anthranilate synthase component 1
LARQIPVVELFPTSFEQFIDEAGRGNVVPVVRSVLADLQTPVGAFMRVAASSPYAFLLESVEGGERVARYSFLGVDPSMIVRGRGNQTTVERTGTSETYAIHPLQYLRDYFRDRELADRRGLPPLAGGAVGFVTYEAARWFEPIFENGKPPERDDAVWMFFRNVLAFDRVRQRVDITSVVLTEEAEGSHERLHALYDEAVAETARLEELLFSDASSTPPDDGFPLGAQSRDGMVFRSNWTKKGFGEGVEAIKERIAAGDCFQAVLSQRFSRQVAADPLTIYRALRTTNPSPYMFFFKLKGEYLIGASPEMLVRCRGKRLDYRPIAGTRKRGATEAEDWMFGEEMRADEKEVAEHTMLVDLGRNDLGRVSDYGTVEIDDLMDIERYSHVQHLVTTLRGRLRDGKDRFDAFAACFPAGTVTGAPKVSAMEIIRQLEPGPRGIYAGAVMYVDFADNLDSCISIRAIEIRNGIASIQSGAGIVADSVPESEYDETINKARAMVRAIEIAEAGL